MDLGASRDRDVPPGHAAAARARDHRGPLLSFTFSFDDVVISNFTAGAGNDTWPLRVLAGLRFGLRPDLNATATMMLAVTLVGLTATALVLRRAARTQGAPAATSSPPVPERTTASSTTSAAWRIATRRAGCRSARSPDWATTVAFERPERLIRDVEGARGQRRARARPARRRARGDRGRAAPRPHRGARAPRARGRARAGAREPRLRGVDRAGLRGRGAARRRRPARGDRPRPARRARHRVRARAPARAPRRARGLDGLLPVQQHGRSRRAWRSASTASSAWRSSTGTCTTATGPRRSSTRTDRS